MLRFALGSIKAWEDLVANVDSLRALKYNVFFCAREDKYSCSLR